MSELYGLILTGGSGTRLWPRSREDLPKQFLALSGTRTLFQETIVRMLRILPVEHLRAVTGAPWSSLVAHQAREIAGPFEDFVVTEPTMRSTAARSCASPSSPGPSAFWDVPSPPPSGTAGGGSG